jgi:ComF family protein
MSWHGLTYLLRGLAQLVFPNSCLICDAAETECGGFRHGLCTACHLAVTHDGVPSCVRCGLNVGPHIDTRDPGCAACRRGSLSFDSVVRLGPYQGRLREAVLRMKSRSGEALGEMMGRVFLEVRESALRETRPDLIVPVPIHWRRAWTRGHNQSAGVARELGSGLGVRFAPGCLRRVRHTPQQVQPSASARRKNVRGAFRATRGASVAGKRILLVDDVMTTGSTAGEAARTLRNAGAASVAVAILARR